VWGLPTEKDSFSVTCPSGDWWAETGKLSLGKEVTKCMGQYFIAVNKTKK
jgi:hypothetical protein